MVTLSKEFAVNHPSFHDDAPCFDPRRTYLSGETGVEVVQCFLHINRVSFPIELPASLLAENRNSTPSDIVLAVSAEEPRPVRRESAPTPAQQREANRWVAEMEDFDRF